MGSATAYYLARRGLSVRLFEQYAIGHDLGSSHGYSRIIRRAYFEHPDYVPLVDRSFELWRELEAESGENLLTVTGIIEMGTPGSELLKGSALSCAAHNIPHERLSATQIRARFPQFAISDDMEGIWQKDAGILAVERCILTYRFQARKHGAILHEEEEVLALQADAAGERVTITTRKGSYAARKAVVCAGAWSSRLLSELKLPLTVERQALGFYRPLERAPFELGTFPLFIMQIGGQSFYGFPLFGVDCVKVAHHHGGVTVTPDTVDRLFGYEDDRLLRAFLKQYIPRAAGKLKLGKICLYTNTPDYNFILDQHPQYRNVLIAAGFSGHGFKFSGVVGEIMADLAESGRTRHPIGRFELRRFKN